jgi:Protein of unknown function (DUF3313)
MTSSATFFDGSIDLSTQNSTSCLHLIAMSALVGATVLSGCASSGGGGGNSTASGSGGIVASQATVSNVRRIGIVTDYSRLKPVPGGSGVLCWRSDTADWKRYDKVMFERIQVSLIPGTTNMVDPADLKMLTDYFYNALVAAIKPEAQVVNAAGPGVLRVRIALTDLVPTDATDSLIGTAVPYGFVAEIGSGAASGKPAGSTPYMGQTGMQAQFRDGASGAIVAECADNEIGRKYAADLNAGAAGATENWVNGYLDSFSSWSYAKLAFNKWAAVFAQRFHDLRVAG